MPIAPPAIPPAGSPSAPRVRVGIDIGGTFTDLVLAEEGADRIRVGKVLTTPRDPAEGTLTGFRHILDLCGLPAAAVGTVIHATTLVTNALIERKGAATGLITTKGFADLLEIRREKRFDLYDLFLELPEPLVPEALRMEVPERTCADGRVVEPVSESAVAEAADALRRKGVRSVAIAFLHAMVNPSNEMAAEEAIRRAHPDLWVSRSSSVAAETGEYERTSTTAANAYVQPIVDRYLERLQESLKSLGFGGELCIMLSNGGFAAAEGVRRFPVRIVESGPAGGALAAAQIAGRCGEPHALGFDMGGTTAKICLIENGEPATVNEFEVARTSRFQKGSGLPVLTPTVDLVEIGAGGGSIAHVNPMGLLQVGPQSAGADPGPACYGRGGEAPTVTDANLLLGYLNPDYFLGGEMRLEAAAAREAVGALAKRVPLDPEEAAWGIYELVTEQMAAAARVHIAEKGADPREYVLIATGGAGPLHACHMARKLHIGRVVCPPAVGVASAVGLLMARPRSDVVRAFVSDLGAIDWKRTVTTFDEMARQAREGLGAPPREEDGWGYRIAADMRYRGQVHYVTVQVPGEGFQPVQDPGGMLRLFEETYLARYRRKMEEVPVELAAWRLTLIGPRPALPPVMAPPEDSSGRPLRKKGRPMFDGPEGGFVEGAVYDRYALPEGETFRGPAVIEERESTIVIPARAVFRRDGAANIHITWEAGKP